MPEQQKAPPTPRQRAIKLAISIAVTLLVVYLLLSALLPPPSNAAEATAHDGWLPPLGGPDPPPPDPDPPFGIGIGLGPSGSDTLVHDDGRRPPAQAGVSHEVWMKGPTDNLPKKVEDGLKARRDEWNSMFQPQVRCITFNLLAISDWELPADKDTYLQTYHARHSPAGTAAPPSIAEAYRFWYAKEILGPYLDEIRDKGFRVLAGDLDDPASLRPVDGLAGLPCDALARLDEELQRVVGADVYDSHPAKSTDYLVEMKWQDVATGEYFSTTAIASGDGQLFFDSMFSSVPGPWKGDETTQATPGVVARLLLVQPAWAGAACDKTVRDGFAYELYWLGTHALRGRVLVSAEARQEKGQWLMINHSAVKQDTWCGFELLPKPDVKQPPGEFISEDGAEMSVRVNCDFSIGGKLIGEIRLPGLRQTKVFCLRR